jgi:threonine-phosphate decarboxylase
MQNLIHGGDVYRHPDAIDFSSNMNPFGTPASVIEAARKALLHIRSYPDPLCLKLREALARKHRTDVSQIICGNGAAELLYTYARALRPKKALLPAPAFAEYELALAGTGCSFTYYPLRAEKDFAVEKDFTDCLQSGIDLVVLCNPNNPTGRLTDPALLEEIVEICRSRNIRLLVDECFLDFCSEKDRSLVPFLADNPNLFLLKAFTKLYAMAGLRLGYALCSDTAFLEQMRLQVQPWNVSLPAQEAGLAALGEDDYVKRTVRYLEKERPWMKRELEQAGLKVSDGRADYLFFQGPANLAPALLEKGILIRDCANYRGLGEGCYRAAVRLHEENLRLTESLREHLRGR